MKTLVRASRSRSGSSKEQRRATNLLGRIGLARAVSFSDAAQFVVDKFGAFDFEASSYALPTTTFEGRMTSARRRQGRAPHRGWPRAHERRRDRPRPVRLPHRILKRHPVHRKPPDPLGRPGPKLRSALAIALLELDVEDHRAGPRSPSPTRPAYGETKEYWEYLSSETRAPRFAAGLSAEEAARDLALDGFDHLARPRTRRGHKRRPICRQLAGDRIEARSVWPCSLEWRAPWRE